MNIVDMNANLKLIEKKTFKIYANGIGCRKKMS